MSSVWLELREVPVNGTYISVLEPVTEPIVSSKVIKSLKYYASIYIYILRDIHRLYIAHDNLSDACRCSRGSLPDNYYIICADCFNNTDWNNSIKFISEKVQIIIPYKL